MGRPQDTMAQNDIIIRGAREHNLQNVNLRLPRNKLIVMTGVSGSGKSSLAFDTLYAEGQRRYVESLSTYARQFLGQMPKPDFDAITGLSPSISIQQKTAGRNPRSTVGTITEIYDYFRVLFARVGQGHCTSCNRQITAQSTEQIVDSIAATPAGTRFQILAPMVQQQKGEFRDLFDDLLKRGFLRARADGKIVQLTDDLQLDRQMRHTIEVVVDRLIAGKTSRSRLAEAVELALNLSGGNLLVAVETDEKALKNKPSKKKSANEKLYSSHYSCSHCGISFEPPSPQLFSFNSPLGMCHECNGLGMRHDFVLEKLIPDDKKNIARGAIEMVGSIRKIGRWKRHIYLGVAKAIEDDLKLPSDSLLKTPWKDLPEAVRRQFLYGTGDRNITFTWGHSGGTWKHGGTFEGVVPQLLEKYRTTRNSMRRRQLEKYMQFVDCSSCGGSRLNNQATHVTLATNNADFSASHSADRLSLPEVCGLSIAEAADFFESLDLNETGAFIAEEILKEIRGRLGFLLRCGLDYLTLDRTAPTLSGGETQRIRLAGQIGCGLVGVIYILDEPSIGLHPRDNELLLESLCDLRDQGNTVIVVEHDEETMRAADYVVDFGPGPGVRGGEVVEAGSLNDILKNPRSLTGQYLSGKAQIEIPKGRRKSGKQSVTIHAASHNNLKNIDAEFPLGAFICVTGVSGSGKSSLVNDILWQTLNRDVNRGKGKPGNHKKVVGLKHLDKAIDIDQSPIGRTPRSNPATYVKVFDLIRDLFTKLPESKIRGYKPGRFSFNVPGGRCEYCEGYGSTKLEMDFLADIWVTCPVCEGRRFHHETLEVRYKGSNISEVLDMDIQQAIQHFANIPKIMKLLTALHDVGLDYLKLGQPSPTLSGGEAQRIKLARELGKRSTGNTIYILDEPTTGLHFADVKKLLEVLHGFVDAGNTVLVVEHNLDVIKTADWVIDLGPEGGAGGGTIVAAGPPELIAAEPKSQTGQALSPVLNGTGHSKKKKRSSNGKKPQDTSQHSARWQIAHKQNSSNGKNGQKEIVINGAAQHNLQHVSMTVPRNRMSVFCGPSGSGKTSLAMDTLYAEGQRRYVESLSSYARQFLGQMPKPKVEHIHGLSPAIAIEQKNIGHTPRSTVGTVTEIYDYLRILFARLGNPYCPDCNVPIQTQTTDQVIEKILEYPAAARMLILAPQEIRVGQSYDLLWKKLASQGFLRVRIDGTTHRLEDVPEIDRRRKHQVEVVVDRIVIQKKHRSRIAESVESALELGQGEIRIAHCDSETTEADWQTDHFSLHFACQKCSRSFEELTPHSFSFNSSLGWCEACDGLGTEQGTNLSALIDDQKLSLEAGAVSAWPEFKKNPLFRKMMIAVAKQFQIPLDVSFYHLAPRHQRIVLYGTGNRLIEVVHGKKQRFKFQYKGLYPAIEEASRVSFPYRQRLRSLVGEAACSVCNGSRLRDDAAAVQFHEMTIQHLCNLPLNETLDFLKTVKLSKTEKKIAGDLLTEAVHRLSFLVDVGLNYLSLSRTLPSLSGGEMQRIRLAGQIGRALTGVLYVLDEPTIGLHPRDNHRLLTALKRLRDIGNTLILVEHDREVLDSADRLYDFGPGAGRLGGNIVGQGTPKQLRRQKKSLTGQYLSGNKTISIPKTRRMLGGTKAETPPGGGWLELTGARQNNLRHVDLRIPLGTFTCITGVSGSGKSSLIEDTLAKAVAQRLHHVKDITGPYDKLIGIELVNKMIMVDQQPLGSTPASNPATYTGVFDHIRDLFSRLPDSKVRGYRPGRFSFNRSGGRCDDCDGYGQKCIEMHFLPDVWVECETCKGKRYNQETLAVKFRGKSISDVLEMPIGQALELFENIPKIRGFLSTLCAIGLDYLTLGQPAPTLSGGEAQRVKLAAELAKPNTGKTLYLLDEPTTGLHFDDIEKLLMVLNSLVEMGNTVVVIEHNLDVIKTADWLVDLGPEAGNEGGWIVAQGTPEEIVSHWEKSKESKKLMYSYTGEMLAPVLATDNRTDRQVFDVKSTTKKRDGDLNLAQIGKEAQMPWQKNGRQWHCIERLSHQGNTCRWEGTALELVIDTLGSIDGLSPVNWNHRSVVEVMGDKKQGGWFLHALTGEEWLLTLKFRVHKNSFQQEELRKRFPFKTMDELDELPVYGKTKRVRAKNLKGPWQEISISVHWLEEIDTPEFKQFLQEAADAFLKQTNKAKLNPADLTPWKVLGRKWHLSRKGFPSNKRVSWNANVLEQLADLLETVHPTAEIDWANKQVVYYGRPDSQDNWATLHTKRRGGIDLTLHCQPGKFALGRISSLGSDREISPGKGGRETIKIRFDQASQVKSAELKKFLLECAQ